MLHLSFGKEHVLMFSKEGRLLSLDYIQKQIGCLEYDLNYLLDKLVEEGVLKKTKKGQVYGYLIKKNHKKYEKYGGQKLCEMLRIEKGSVVNKGIFHAENRMRVNETCMSIFRAEKRSRRGNSICANYAGQNLEEVDFSGLDISGSDFTNCNLKEANFSGAIGSGMIFQGADLTDAIFTKAIFDGVNFRSAKIHGVDFSDTSIDFGFFDGADIQNVLMEGARWFFCNFDKESNLYNINVTSSILTGTNFGEGSTDKLLNDIFDFVT